MAIVAAEATKTPTSELIVCSDCRTPFIPEVDGDAWTGLCDECETSHANDPWERSYLYGGIE
jgi:hypothetical protein